MQRETRLQRSHLLGTSVNLTLNLLTTTIVAPPSNASKWQMGFNSAFKGLKPVDSNPIFQSFCFGGDYITGESNIISTNTSNKFSV